MWQTFFSPIGMSVTLRRLIFECYKQLTHTINKAEMGNLIMMETISEKSCVSVFAHNDEEEIAKAFTNLWIQVINQKENQQLCILQTNESDL